MSKWKGLPEDYSNVFSFIYLIRNNHPDSKRKYYIGKKQCMKRVKRKPLKGKTRNRITFKDNDVEEYWGSSKELLADIQKYGIEYFTKEIIELCNSKFHATWAELKWQMACNVLMDERFYNQIINIRLSRVPKDYIDINRDPAILNL